MIAVNKIEELIKEELADANSKHDLFHSPHEAYAVILEEFEEMTRDVSTMEAAMREIWSCTKRDIEHEEIYEKLKKVVVYTVQEAIQVAAMAEKAIQSLYND